MLASEESAPVRGQFQSVAASSPGWELREYLLAAKEQEGMEE